VTVDLLTALVMVVGLVGTVIPFLPGLPLIVMSAAAWAVLDGSDAGQWLIFAAVTTICVAAMIVASVVPARRASDAGATGWVLAGGVVGLLAGAIAIPVVGALIGWPVGILAAEVIRTRDLPVAWRTTRSTLVGLGLGIAIQLGAGVVAVGIWAAAVWRW